jgi:hypothetical protein
MSIKPVTHIEKAIAGETTPVTHLEKVIAQYGGGGGGGEIDIDSAISGTSRNPVENRAIAAALESKADADDIVDFVTETVVNDMIVSTIGGITTFEYYLCGQGEYDPNTGIPTVQGADTSHIYLVPTSGENLNMYAYINNAFTFLGTTEVNLDDYAKTNNLADVAFSGDYADLDNAPTIPAAVTVDPAITQGGTNPVEGGAIHTALAAKANSNDLASVAFSGAYSDLSGKPSLAAVATSGSYSDLSGKPNLATVATSGSYNDLSNKPALKTVATSGSYNDLSNKPTIPTVPSNLTLGKKSGTNTQLTINIIDSGTPDSNTPDTTITIVKG